MTAVAVGAFLFSVTLLENATVAAFYNPLSRVWELALGGLVAAAVGRVAPIRSGGATGLLGVTGMGLILSAVWRLTPDTPYPGWAALLPTVGCSLFILAGPQGWVNQHMLSLLALTSVGLISFPLVSGIGCCCRFCASSAPVPRLGAPTCGGVPERGPSMADL